MHFIQGGCKGFLYRKRNSQHSHKARELKQYRGKNLFSQSQKALIENGDVGGKKYKANFKTLPLDPPD